VCTWGWHSTLVCTVSQKVSHWLTTTPPPNPHSSTITGGDKHPHMVEEGGPKVSKALADLGLEVRSFVLVGMGKYGSPVRITGPGGKELMLLVSDADQVAQICSDENVFQKNKPRKGTALCIIQGDNENPGLFLLGTEEQDWGIGRRILINAFSMKSMRIYLPIINEQMRALSKAYEDFGSTYFDSPDLMTQMTYDSIALAMMNVKFNSIEDVGTDHVHEFIKNMQINLGASNYLVAHPL